MASKLYFKLSSVAPIHSDASGSMTAVMSRDVPGFVNISFGSLTLQKGAAQEPIWHPNANKIGYCLGGEAHVQMRTPAGVEAFSIKAGDLFFIPQGYAHQVTNSGAAKVDVVYALDNTDPEIMRLSKALHSLSENVFGATFGTKPGFLDGLTKTKAGALIKTLPAGTKQPEAAPSSRYKYTVGSSRKTIETKGGYLQPATKANLPTLNGLGVLRFGLNPKGNVEPHWHTNAGELVYIVKGHTRITVLSPDGKVEVLEVKGGEGAFAPASHFHNIENLGDDEVEVIAFFSHAEPDYIGIAEVMGAYPTDLLASVFNVAPNYFDGVTLEGGPLVIVPV